MTDHTPTTDTNGQMPWGRQLVRQSPSSDRQISEWSGHPALKPATPAEFRTELSGCLALVAPAGFDETARKEWLAAAWGTLNGIPADLLSLGCKVARQNCDHPSKVVPAIMREVELGWTARKSAYGERPNARPAQPNPEPEFERVTPEQMEAIKAELGLKTAPYPEVRTPKGPQRKPTREDYIALGVDPSILDRLPGMEA